MVITTSLSVYYLPRLSEIKDKSELKKEVLAGYKLIMPIAIFLALSVYLLKEYIILIAFSESFMPMIDLFLWQLVGDVIKIASWLLGYITLAKAMTKTYISLEIFGSLSFIGLSIYFIDLYGLVGVTYAFSLNYAIYMFVLFFIYKRYVNENIIA